jgi:hypothetical protein
MFSVALANITAVFRLRIYDIISEVFGNIIDEGKVFYFTDSQMNTFNYSRSSKIQLLMEGFRYFGKHNLKLPFNVVQPHKLKQCFQVTRSSGHGQLIVVGCGVRITGDGMTVCEMD